METTWFKSSLCVKVKKLGKHRNAGRPDRERPELRGRSYSDWGSQPSKLAKDGLGGLEREGVPIPGDAFPDQAATWRGSCREQMVDGFSQCR